MLQVLAEELPNIQVCNFYISLPVSQRCQKVCFQKSECALQFEDETVITLLLPKGTHLVPCELKCVKQEGSMITVRAQMNEKSSLISALGADLLSDAGMLFTSESLQNVMAGHSVSAHCKNCNNKIHPNVCLRRVLPLPSVDWDQSSEGWFCHLHNDDSKKLKPASMIPRCDECFYSELFFLLNGSLLEDINVKCSIDNLINCKGCENSLGEFSNPSLKLWTHNVEWFHENGEIIFSKSVSDILLTLFENINKDNFGVNCRLVLKVSSPLTYLYLVTMNTSQKLLLSEFHNNDDDGRTKSMLDNHDLSYDKKMKQGNCTDINLRKLFAIKLLYQVKEKDDEETGSWDDDVDVHILPCSISFFEKVKTMLDMSSTFLPFNMRIFDKMNVGYIFKK